MEIVISDEVGTVLRSLCAALNMNTDQLLRRFLGLEPPTETPESSPVAGPAAAGSFRTREGLLPLGLHLRKVFKGREYHATVQSDGIHVEGINGVFFSPSLAGVAVTGYNTNGWVFWEFWNEKDKNWMQLDYLRKITPLNP